jgi:hypothetical protein
MHSTLCVCVCVCVCLCVCVCVCVQGLSDPEIPLADVKVPEAFWSLIRVVDSVAKGEFEWDPAVDWVAKAAAIDPVDLAELLGGESDRDVQRICRDCKLLDAVFDMGAEYARCASNLGRGGLDEASLAGPRAVQKIVFIALQTLCMGNDATEAYLGRRAPMGFGKRPGRQKPWMDTLLSQLDEPLGAAVRLF